MISHQDADRARGCLTSSILRVQVFHRDMVISRFAEQPQIFRHVILKRHVENTMDRKGGGQCESYKKCVLERHPYLKLKRDNCNHSKERWGKVKL